MALQYWDHSAYPDGQQYMFAEEEVVMLGNFLKPFQEVFRMLYRDHIMLYELCSIYALMLGQKEMSFIPFHLRAGM